jgi:hypothetical protein
LIEEVRVTEVTFDVDDNRKVAFALDCEGVVDVLNREVFGRDCSGDPDGAKRHDGRKAE